MFCLVNVFKEDTLNGDKIIISVKMFGTKYLHIQLNIKKEISSLAELSLSLTVFSESVRDYLLNLKYCSFSRRANWSCQQFQIY